MAYKYYFFYNILCVIILQSFAKQLSLRLNIQPFAEYAVAPYVGAWIETGEQNQLNKNLNPSHPTWVRGLKQTGDALYVSQADSRTLRGCVD